MNEVKKQFERQHFHIWSTISDQLHSRTAILEWLDQFDGYRLVRDGVREVQEELLVCPVERLNKIERRLAKLEGKS